MLGLRSEREVRGSKIRDGEGQGRAGGMVRRNLGREGEVFREADACCTASTAAPAAERKRWGRGGRETESVLQYETGTVQEIHYQKQHNYITLISPHFSSDFLFLFLNGSGESNKS